MSANREAMTSSEPTPGSPGSIVDRLTPQVGWSTVALVTLLTLTAAWSIEDARWILDRHALTGFLWEIALLSVAWGVVAAVVRWSRLPTYLLGAILAALIVPVLVGRILLPGADVAEAFRATAHATAEAYLDLAWRGKSLTQQVGHYMLTLGLIVWATGMFAAYAVVKRRRPVDAVVVTGLVLIIDMSLTRNDQLYLLVLFTIAALLLLVRLHATDEAAVWLRRRMGDSHAVSSMYVRGGVAFAAAAVLGSLVLTSTASSAPLAGAWTGVQQSVIDVGQALEPLFPRGGQSRITGVAFGPTATITGQWVTDSGIALQIQVPRSDTTPHYWRAVAYDRFELQGWSMSDTSTSAHDAKVQLAGAMADDVADPTTMTSVSFTVRPAGYRGRSVFTPGVPSAVSVPTRLSLVGGAYFATLDRTNDPTASYDVRALVPTIGDTPGGLTENRLRVAGTRYPALVKKLYLDVPPDSVGPNATDLLKTVRGLAPGTDPYDLAKTMEAYLRSNVFTYTTDVAGLDCGDRSVVECFATYRQGYCQHYASTMTVLLRLAGIPARFVEGFLPGQRDGSGLEVIRNSASHAWVEVYFPRYGWVSFDPTGGGVARLTSLPTGAPVASLPPSSSSGDSSDNTDIRGELNRPPGGPGGAGTTSSSGSGGTGPFALVALVLLAVVVIAAFEAYRRGPRQASAPEAVFASVSSIAARLGFARRPTETVYEYAGSLGDALPAARPELETVAHATVEVAYGKQVLPEDRIDALVRAEQRLRVTLLRLLFRRDRRRR